MIDAPASADPGIAGTGSTVLDDIAEVIGLAGAFQLAAAYRGIRLYVPKNASSDPAITAAIGEELTAKLCRVFGGTTISLPQREALRGQVHYLRRCGLTHAQIAQQLKIGERQVYRLLKKPAIGMTAQGSNRADDRQMQLF